MEGYIQGLEESWARIWFIGNEIWPLFLKMADIFESKLQNAQFTTAISPVFSDYGLLEWILEHTCALL